MRVSYHEGYFVDLPEGHPFPMPKYVELHNILLDEGLLRPEDICPVEELDWDDALLVHTAEYVSKLRYGTLSHKEQRKLGLPWSPTLVKRARVSAQGTLNATRMALEDGIAANLGGGTHHAFPGHGEGFCVLNDVAITTRALRRDGFGGRVLVIDLDVHQGNGTAFIFERDPSVYTFSMHGERNYPFPRQRSTRDVNVPDGAGDGLYLDLLGRHLPVALDEARPDLIFYLAGVDVAQGDRLGRVGLTPDGLRQREEIVLAGVRKRGCPVVLLMAGGYAQTARQTAELHAILYRVAMGRVLK